VPEVYWSYAQLRERGNSAFNIVVRASRGNPIAIETSVRAAIHAIDPGAAVSSMEPMTDVIAEAVGAPRFYLSLIGTFALVAVALAVAGLYGVMSYAVASAGASSGSAPRSVVPPRGRFAWSPSVGCGSSALVSSSA